MSSSVSREHPVIENYWFVETLISQPVGSLQVSGNKVVQVEEWTEEVKRAKSSLKGRLDTALGVFACPTILSVFIAPVVAIALAVTVSLFAALYPLAALAVLSVVTFGLAHGINKISDQEHAQTLLKIQKLWQQKHSDVKIIDSESRKMAYHFVLATLKTLKEVE